jgi:hypothetical protein
MRVRRLARGADDGYRSGLAPGLRSSTDAERLAEELAYAVHRLRRLEEDPPGLYGEVARGREDLEEASWLAFLIAYLGPLEGVDPFASIREVHMPWREASGLSLDAARPGARGSHDPSRGVATVQAYRAWAARAGSQAAALSGEAAWTAERRFDRIFERLALPGLQRDARFDLLVTLGRLGLFDVRAGRLVLGGVDEVTVAAKRVFGIGDALLLERRAAELARAAGVAVEALDLALFNWGRGAGGEDAERDTGGLGADAEPDPQALDSARGALGL